MRKTMLLGAALALLIFVAAAQAKEMKYTAVCGASGCKALKPAIAGDPHGLAGALVPPLQSYYVLRVGYGDGNRISVYGQQYFVAGAGVVIGKDVPGPSDGWAKLRPATAAALRGATAGVRPYAAPVPARAYVGTRRVADARPFMALLGPLKPAALPHTGESPVAIGLEWKKANPWSAAGALLNYLPKAHVLIRLDGYFQVPAGVADLIDRARR